ncbi:MAG: hypothetical protein NWQ38_16660 [Cellulophaga sp.]|nr:hypothetical protein [Cellulophaga sp.]
MQTKENDQSTKFIKEPEENTQQFIIQKNKKTKLAVIIILVFLVVIITGIVLSGQYIA